MGKYRIMSNNQWWCDKNTPQWAEKGLDCSTEARAKGFARYYSETLPDIIGMQESSAKMVEELMIETKKIGLEYSVLWGRDTPIFYRPDKFELKDSYFTFHEASVPGFEGEFNNYRTKSYTIGVFRTKATKKTFVFTTTHLWWKSGDPKNHNYQKGSDEAREYQLARALEKTNEFAEKYSCPAIVVGDMNSTMSSLALRCAMNSGYTHALEAAVEYADQNNGYHRCDGNGYGPYVPSSYENAIDHILVRAEDTSFVRRFDRYAPEYYMPLSDHIPVWIDVNF